MDDKEKKLSAEQKRKILLVLRIIVLSAAVLYLLFSVYNDNFIEDSLSVYFSNADAEYLKIENRDRDVQTDLYLQLFEELKAGPENDNLRITIPEGSKLIGYELDDDLIILNFNSALKDNHWGGSTGEIMTVYSIVNTYTALDEIKRVKILIEGSELESLVGHLDLTEPLMYNQKLTEGS